MGQIAGVEMLELELRAATLASDVSRLRELLADDLVFTNQDGVRLSKNDDLAAHHLGLLKIGQLDFLDPPVIRMFGDAAVAVVTADLRGEYEQRYFSGRFAYTRVWQRTDRQWRVVFAHCSEVALPPYMSRVEFTPC